MHIHRTVCLAADARALRLRARNTRQEWAVVFNQFLEYLWIDMSHEAQESCTSRVCPLIS